MIFALFILFANQTFPQISWHNSPEECHAAAHDATEKAEPVVREAACFGVERARFIVINRQIIWNGEIR